MRKLRLREVAQSKLKSLLGGSVSRVTSWSAASPRPELGIFLPEGFQPALELDQALCWVLGSEELGNSSQWVGEGSCAGEPGVGAST